MMDDKLNISILLGCRDKGISTLHTRIHGVAHDLKNHLNHYGQSDTMNSK